MLTLAKSSVLLENTSKVEDSIGTYAGNVNFEDRTRALGRSQKAITLL